ncbi:TPA: hypothetical protein N0F65_003885 [Lagenidium giganteum]|uniref:Uncharacterized protein n=1 Tax=Lagenidium giganteum TaxID=4803 RepID=A0AAV2ZB71_9STRA|nr:TPA: hypothetical protein N0F65_003885 [Lagenidium giganteum]
MVVLQHDQLHQTLWGPAVRDGRRRAIDALAYMQMVPLIGIGICCAIDYDKAITMRAAITAAATLLYFRNTLLAAKLLLFLSLLMLYGDVFIPIRALALSGELDFLAMVRLACHVIVVGCSFRILFGILSTAASQRSGKRRYVQRSVKAAKSA